MLNFKMGFQSKAKTPKNVLLSLLNKFRKESATYTSKELEFLIGEALNAINDLERVGIVELDRQKGHSNLELIKYPDKIIAKTFQRMKRDGTPQIMKVTILREELNACIGSLNWIHKNQEGLIETKEIARHYFKILGITENRKGLPLFKNNEFIWNNFFSDRMSHVKLCTCLSILHKEGMIDYNTEKKGYSKIINNKISIQEILKT